MKSKKYEIFLITGGTAGHIIPAINFSNYLKRNNISNLIMTDNRGLKYFDNKEYDYRIISSSHLKKSNLQFVKAIFLLILGFFQFSILLVKFRPKNILTFGSYVSFSPLLSTIIFKKLLKTKIYFHEQNSVIGKVHKIFSFASDKIFLTYEKTIGISKRYNVIYSGFPINQDIIKYQKKYFKDYTKKKIINLFIFGGSQGALNLSRKIVKLLIQLPLSSQKLIKLTIQVPEIDIENIKLQLKKTKIIYEIDSFFYDMILRLSKSDLCICRAGSSTIHELHFLRIPSILVPLPSASNNHQYYNAKFLSESGGAILIEENNLLNEDNLNTLNHLICNINLLKKMSINLEKIDHIKSNNLIFNEIFNR